MTRQVKRARDPGRAIAREVSLRIAQGGPMKGRVYFFDTIVASRRGLRECRGMVYQLVMMALEEYREEIYKDIENAVQNSRSRGGRRGSK